MKLRFNPPPGWPDVPSPAWTPPPGWQPQPDWPAAPADWNWWAPVETDEPPRYWVAAGAGVMALSPFLPWLQVPLFGSLNLFDLFRLSNRSSIAVIPWLFVVAGL